MVALGQFDLYTNGRRQGDGFLNGPWSQYDRTLYGDAPYLLAAVVDVEYSDGGNERIVTGPDWGYGPDPFGRLRPNS